MFRQRSHGDFAEYPEGRVSSCRPKCRQSVQAERKSRRMARRSSWSSTTRMRLLMLHRQRLRRAACTMGGSSMLNVEPSPIALDPNAPAVHLDDEWQLAALAPRLVRASALPPIDRLTVDALDAMRTSGNCRA